MMDAKDKKVGFIYDERMLLHKLSKQPPHPECPERIEKIIENLKKTGLWSQLDVINQVEPIQKDILNKVHRDSYVDLVEQMWPEGCEKENMVLNGCYYNKYTGQSAFLSSGAVIQSIDLIKSKSWHTAFCCVRPPGHHSGASQQCSGFCFFNNVVVGAKYLREKYSVKKIAIFDFDVHHGDGTQALTYDDHELLFISIHQYDEGKFYPFQSGDLSKVGNGFNINIGWNTSNFQSAGDDEYIYAFESIVMPALTEFQPDFIFISAGFDSAANDKLGRCQLTNIGYEYMSSRLVQIFPNLLFVLEGGYNLDSIQWASEAVIRRILDPLNEKQLESLRNNILPNQMSIKVINECKLAHNKFWKLQDKYNITNIIEKNQFFGKSIISDFSKNFKIDNFNDKLYYTLNQIEIQYLEKPEFRQLLWHGNQMKQFGNEMLFEIQKSIDVGFEIKIVGEDSIIIKGIKTKDFENRQLDVINQTIQYQQKVFEHFTEQLKEKKQIIYDSIKNQLKEISNIPINSQLIIDGSNCQVIISHIPNNNSNLINIQQICEQLSSYFYDQEKK
ncbi:histone deacetylasehistone-like deacetylase family, classII protein (macronuclear) [Tetrahymena thermophila SB210]|uniref:histone deacetylase n=1 Tax=Tetrahymena thermophila (strain SB210) TaxID=312017 RepID=Q22CW6_TETTS|nr:histone deacetylasehistone-like deacetylase family, classII protein [Tetrahymena thermophila SB210]EAR83153.3 histone deacetylasehistone-like deacetylase family, classII protein [Tetrahymena thermophila SB210]|eukprot:XP_001030816.3 histone deacetylasehistone-like deacetylase family, classII protein [Tetrahymena thermophila SB210]